VGELLGGGGGGGGGGVVVDKIIQYTIVTSYIEQMLV